MKRILFAFLLLLCFKSFTQAPTDPRLKGLDTFVTKVLKDWNAAGVTIAVVEKNKVVYTGGFGFRDLEKNYR
jgi:CubicO group peptidase (beta-lactamase class C family)